MTYDVTYFIDKFSKIPEEKWTIEDQGCGDGPKCALGHCDPLRTGNGHATDEGADLKKLFNILPYEKERVDYVFATGKTEVAFVNNGYYAKYQQETPKQRILAALYDIKKMQQPQYPDITKSLAVIVERVETDVIMVSEIK